MMLAYASGLAAGLFLGALLSQRSAAPRDVVYLTGITAVLALVACAVVL